MSQKRSLKKKMFKYFEYMKMKIQPIKICGMQQKHCLVGNYSTGCTCYYKKKQ